jgi:UDP-GlcNAc:undecaprenyl-phosphate GlcNAc-1-phosphate transferase
MPSARKMHTTADPLLGGIAVYIGFLAGLALRRTTIEAFYPILAGATIILILGLVDDIRHLSARFRLVVQLAASLIVVIFADRVNFMPPGYLGDAVEIIVSLVWMIGITNAYNYLDGLDGLAAGSAVINLACFGGILYMTSQSTLLILCAVLMAACAGFLPYNFSAGKRKMFLGDAGSTFLGFVLASVGLVGYWAEGSAVKISIPILILGVPIFDMVFTTVMRISEKKIGSFIEWLKYAGKDHFHHYLVDLGMPVKGAVIFIYFATISLGLSALLISDSARPSTAVLSVFQGFMVFAMVSILIVMGKRRHDRPGGK